MFESLLITTREGVEAALVVGLIVIALRKTGRVELIRWVMAGLGLAVLASLLGAWAMSKLPVNQELFEGVLMFVAAFFVINMTIWMWKTASGLSSHIREKVAELSEPTGPVGSAWKAGAGVLAFTFLMVFREGVETVLFLSAVSLNTEGILTAIGVLAGIALSVFFGVGFVRGSLRVDLRRFFAVTGTVLIILAVQLVIAGVHEFAEGGLVSFGPREMSIVGPIVKNNALFLIAMLSLPSFFFLLSGKSVKEDVPLADQTSGAERRLALAKTRRVQFWKRTANIFSIGALSLMVVGYAYSRGPKTIDPPVLVSAQENKIILPIETVDDGALHRFGYVLGADVIRFLVLKDKDGSFKTAFDACAICGAKGYVQEAGRVICLNCTADINTATIGLPGGCNPIPLKAVREGRRLVIALSDLKTESSAFAGGWKPEVVDPVCRMAMRIADAGGKETYEGREYYFCKMPHCQESFRKDPKRYLSAPSAI